MNEVISVIVPIHNAEKYLQECLESIINQSYQELEILLIDDSSTDQSGIICDEYAARDGRIRVIHNITGGEGGAKARNTGINLATGKFLYFMDSDDYIERNMLQQMHDTLCREQSQCVICSFHYIDEKGIELPWYTPQLEKYQTMPGIEAAKIFLTTLNIEGFSWNKMFCKEIIAEHNIRFDESMNSFVDMYGMFQATLSSERVSFCKEQFYYYRQRGTSCVHTMSLRKLGNFRRVIGQIVDEAKNEMLIDESNSFYAYRMTSQLFDAIKDKKSYNKEIWKQIKTEYKWKKIYDISILKVAKILFAYSTHNRLKNLIKVFAVWTYFK